MSHQKLSDQARFVAITNGDSPDRVLKSIHQIGVEGFEHVLVDHSDLWGHFDVSSHPTLVFVEPDGSFSSAVGGQSINRIQVLVEELVDRSA